MFHIIGVFFCGCIITFLVWSSIKHFFEYYLADLLGLNANLKKMGKWAVVTGATDGIGKALCFKLAAKGINIVLISRTLSKLEKVSKEIAEKYPVETKIIDVDFTRVDIYDRLQKELSNLEIGILINNVGKSSYFPIAYSDLHETIIDDLLHCNIYSVVKMCKIVLPQMRERKKGVIINVSSLLGILPSPYFACYGATKAFVTALSNDLEIEEKENGIIVQCWAPSFVATQMVKTVVVHSRAITPDDYAESALKTVGVIKLTAGNYGHTIQHFLADLAYSYLPRGVLENIMKYIITSQFQKK